MNKDKLKLCVDQGYHVRIAPIAIRLDDWQWPSILQPLDDDWLMYSWSEELGIQLLNIHTHHCPWLAFDHIHHYSRDPGRDIAGLKYGFLELNVQIVLKRVGLDIRPLPPDYFRRGRPRHYRRIPKGVYITSLR